MDYEGQICRPPMERSAFMLGVAVGCAYNRCRFCNLFKHLRHRLLPLEQLELELKRVQDLGGNPKQVFLGDGNAFGMETSRLLTILEMVKRYFPACEMINMDATVSDIQCKSDEELRQLKHARVGHLYLGIESGLDDVLAFMQKDHNIDQAYMAITRLQDAGFWYNAHIMTGIAGMGRGSENAEHLAAFFNRTKPQRIINFSLYLSSDTPLYRDALAERFKPASEVENLREERRLLELLDVCVQQYDSFHDAIEVRVRGTLPSERHKMLQTLDDAIKNHNMPLQRYGNGGLLKGAKQEYRS